MNLILAVSTKADRSSGVFLAWSRLLVGLCVLFGCSTAVVAQSEQQFIEVTAGDVAGLTAAIQSANQFSGRTFIEVKLGAGGETEFVFTMPFGNTDNALPAIVGNVVLSPDFGQEGRLTFRADGTDFRLFEVNGNGRFTLGQFNVESFSNMASGGVVRVSDTAQFTVRGTRFRNNASGAEGGVVFAQDDGKVTISDATLEGNRAGSLGGVISLTGNSQGTVFFSIFTNNQAGVFGCDINYASSFMGSSANFGLLVFENTFNSSCENVLIENPLGSMLITNNTFGGASDVIDSTGLVSLFGNLFDIQSAQAPPASRATCNDFGTGAFSSAGFNLLRGNDCFATEATDLVNTDPMTAPADENGVRALLPGSPAIDAGAVDLVSLGTQSARLPCGHKDSRGLGRPQDGNLDGVFECDIGSYEVQGGPDIGAPQSALYFDLDRNGEGTSVEILGDVAFVAQFTYLMDGSGPAWFAGVGQVIGNSVVVDEMQQPQGGVFGDAFDNDLITRPIAGSTSLIFPNCAASAGASGRQVFRADQDSGFEDVLVDATRLTTLVNCQSMASSVAGRSGSFFNPERDGEGIIVQWLDSGQVVIIWYTYDPQGNQFWMISGETTVTGNSVTANMVYPAQSTGFGSGFDPDEISLQPWGTVTLTYQVGCNGLRFDFASSVQGFGSGGYDYSRLTSLLGTSCDL